MNEIIPTQITLNLDLGDSALTIENIVAALTVSDRKDIAKKLLEEWVEKPEVKIKEKLVAEVHASVVKETKELVKEVVHNTEHMQDLVSSVAIKVVDRIPDIIQEVVGNWMREEFRYKMDNLVSDPTYQLGRDLKDIKDRLGMP